MFQLIGRAASKFTGLFKKSTGERKILAMLNGNTSAIVGNLWSGKRAEYANHFTGWNYAAIDAIASAYADMPPQYAYKRDGKQAEMKKCLDYVQRQKALTALTTSSQLEPVSSEHPLVRLNERPNPIDIGWTFRYKIAMFLRISGECYRWNVPNAASIPRESWIIPSHWVWPVSGNGKLIEFYEVRPMATMMPDTQGGFYWFGGGAGKFRIKADQIVPYFLPGPHALVGGYSPIGACSLWTDCTDNIDASRIFRFQNDAFPSVAIEFDKDIDPETITQPEIDRLKAMIKEKYSGVRRTGEPVVLGPGMRLVYMQTTPKDMAYVEGFAQMRDSLMACHKTGPIVVGLGNETTHAAGRAVIANWHASTINPLARMIGQFDTEYMCRPYEENLICYHVDSMPSDVEFEQKQRNEAFDRNALIVDEYRAQLNMPPHPNQEIGQMCLAEIEAEFSVPKGLGMDGSPMDSIGDETVVDPNSRIDHIFKPSSNGNGHGSLLNGDSKMKALADLRNKFLLEA